MNELAGDAVDELLSARTWDELLSLVHDNPVLRTPEAVGSLLAGAQGADQAGARDSVLRMHVYAFLLGSCAELGVDEGVAAWVEQGWKDAGELTRWYEPALRGDPDVDLDGELDLAREVMWIAHYESGPFAELWDQVIMLLRGLLDEWEKRGGAGLARSENSRWARRHLARVPAGSEMWAERAEWFAGAAAAQFQFDGDRDALEEAIDALTDAQEVNDEARRRSNLARLLLYRFEVDGVESDAATALVLAHEAAEELTDPTDRALALDREGMAAADGFTLLGRADLLEHAIACQEEAVELAPADSQWRPGHLGNLAGSLLQREGLRGDEGDGLRAIELLRLEVSLCPTGHELRPDALANLGGTLVALAELSASPDASELTEAVELLDEAVALGGRSHRAVMWRVNLGRALAGVGRHADAVTELTTALDLLGADHPDRAAALFALAEAEAAMDEPAMVVDPLEHYMAAVESGIGSRPDAAIEGAAKGAAWATVHHRDAAARDLYRRGLDVLDAVTGRQTSITDQLAWRRHASRVVNEGAVSLATSGHVDEAVAHVERGRAALMRAGLHQHAGDDDVAGALAFVTEELPLVLLVAGDTTGVALVVDHGSTDSVPLPSFDREQVIARVTEMLTTQANRREPGGASRWNQCLESTARWLHESVVGPLEVECGSLSHLALGVDGLAGLFPFAAAWVPDDSAPNGRRCLVDTTALTMTPSGASLAAAMKAAQQEPQRSLVVAGAVDSGLADLPGALAEAEEVASILPGCTVLTGASAEHEHVVAALEDADILHAAVHGRADLLQPLESGLVLSGGRLLTVADVLNLPRRTRRLAVLSACDTAVPGVEAPTEAVGLPMALLRLGVAGVVASLWPVGDDAARLLIPHMLREWLGVLTLADALAEAQRWLRGLGADEAEAIAGHPFGAERPFAAIRSWGAFTLTGA